MYPLTIQTKEFIENNMKEVCERERITVEECACFLNAPGVSLFLRFLVGRWSIFLCVTCFVLF